MEDLTFQQLVKLICIRPRMFVLDGTFRMVAIFLDGYDAAFAYLTSKKQEETNLGGFQVWLAQKL